MARIDNKKFSKEDIEYLRTHVTPNNAHEIAENYGVAWSTVKDAVTGKRYTEYNEEIPPIEFGRKINYKNRISQIIRDDICRRLEQHRPESTDNKIEAKARKKERSLEVKSIRAEYEISESIVSLIVNKKR